MIAAEPKTSPCADCGTRDGYIPPGQRRPARCNGSPYGLDGTICKACDGKHRARRRVAARRAGLPGGDPAPTYDLSDDEHMAVILPRLAIVRRAKQIKDALGLCPDLTDAELDAVLPPVECQRTRRRLAKGAAWRSQDPMFQRAPR